VKTPSKMVLSRMVSDFLAMIIEIVVTLNITNILACTRQ
jgi:hypothetical protein